MESNEPSCSLDFMESPKESLRHGGFMLKKSEAHVDKFRSFSGGKQIAAGNGEAGSADGEGNVRGRTWGFACLPSALDLTPRWLCTVTFPVTVTQALTARHHMNKPPPPIRAHFC